MRVLLIDDNEGSLAGAIELMRGEGIECEAYASPVAASFAFTFGLRPFDAVVARFEMQSMGGLDVLRIIRTMAPRMPVFLIGEGRASGGRKNPPLSQGQADALIFSRSQLLPRGGSELLARLRHLARRASPALTADAL